MEETHKARCGEGAELPCPLFPNLHVFTCPLGLLRTLHYIGMID